MVTQDQRDGVAVLRLNRPEVLNAINGTVVSELNAALDRIAADSSVALVITGTGRAFCAGADLKERDAHPGGRVAEMHRLVLRLAEFPKVSVAAINGLAFGGGLELAMACSLRVAASTATMGLPEAKRLRAFPAYGGTQLLPRLVGEAKALELILTGDPVDAREAERIGLVNRTADDPLAAAIGLARAASVAMPMAVSAVRRLVAQAGRSPLEDGLASEAGAVAQFSQSPEVRAMIQAFARGER